MQIVVAVIAALAAVCLVACGNTTPYYYEVSPKFEMPKATGAIRQLRDEVARIEGNTFLRTPADRRRVHAYFAVPKGSGHILTVEPQDMEVRAIEMVDSSAMYKHDGFNIIVVFGHVPVKTSRIRIQVRSEKEAALYSATLALEAMEFGLYCDVDSMSRVRSAKATTAPSRDADARVSSQSSKWPVFQRSGNVLWTGAYRKGDSWLIVDLSPK